MEQQRSDFKSWHLPKFRVALAIGAHPDDIEMGCAGTLARIQEMGTDVHCCVMSICEEEHSDEETDIRKKEFTEASKILEVKTCTAQNFPNRELPAHSTELMDYLGGLQKELQPELVLMPWIEDSHQDHSALAYAAIRSFRKNETIIQYEILRYGSHTFTPNLFVDITRHIKTKLNALECYKTQKAKRGIYFDKRSYEALAITRGSQAGFEYAEGFVVYKFLW